jgi:hypothetical protein
MLRNTHEEDKRGIDAHLDWMMKSKQAPRVILALISRDLRVSLYIASHQEPNRVLPQGGQWRLMHTKN